MLRLLLQLLQPRECTRLCQPLLMCCISIVYSQPLQPAIVSLHVFGITRCGQGKVSRGDGYQYSGQWLNDLPHGQGMLTQQTSSSLYLTKLLHSATLLASLLRTADAAHDLFHAFVGCHISRMGMGLAMSSFDTYQLISTFPAATTFCLAAQPKQTMVFDAMRSNL